MTTAMPTGAAAADDAAFAAWTTVLARLETDLMEQLDHLAGVDDADEAPTAYVPPASMPPMPAALRPRAEELLAAIEHVTRELTVQRDGIAGELTRLRRPRHEAARESSAVDARA